MRQLVANEKYAGNSVYNRTSKKLQAKWRLNPKTEWVRKVGAYEAVVPPERFEKAQLQLKENAARYTEGELLNYLTAIWCREKYLSVEIIDRSPNAPSTNSAVPEHRLPRNPITMTSGWLFSVTRAHRPPSYARDRTGPAERTSRKQPGQRLSSRSLSPLS